MSNVHNDYDEEHDLTDEVLDEEADDYYEDSFEDDDIEKENHFQCQRAGTCCLGCEDCDLENECSMCEHDGNSHYCDTCTVADEY